MQPAVAIRPGQPDSLHLTEIPRAEPGPGQVLIRVRQAGICGTDRELIRGHFGAAPPGEPVLVLGHELLGEVAAVGPEVAGFTPGELVTATVRRPDGCPSCQAGQPDMCQWHRFTERGIVGRHGFMTETIVEEARWLVGVPPAVAAIGVLTEPLSVVEKALRQAQLMQRRMAVWEPRTALVLGTGPIGLLGTLLLRARGIAVVTAGRRPAPHLAAQIVAAAGARYVAVEDTKIPGLAATLPPFDLIFEASGRAAPAFAAMEVLARNGVLMLLSGTGGNAEMAVPIDRINRGLLGGNKIVAGSVNSAREDFALAVADLQRFEALWPGLAGRLITRRLAGLGEYPRITERPAGDIKTVIEVG